MSCCGQKRAAISKPVSPAPILPDRPAPNAVAWFQYTGTSALTVFGIATQMSYRFPHQGAVLAADVRDTMSLAAVPSLQRINEPRHYKGL